MNFEPLPYISNENLIPNDGFLEKKFRFCQLHYNQRCASHYKNLSGEGEYICPYGFTTVVKITNGKRKIFTSFELEKSTNRKEVQKRRNIKDNKRRFLKTELNELFKWYESLQSNLNAKQNLLWEYDKKTSRVNQKEEVLDDTLHELRKLNNALKKQAFVLKSNFEKGEFDKNDIEYGIKNIFSTSQLVSARLNAYDFTLNPTAIEINPKVKVNLYKKFEKAKHCLELFLSEKNQKIQFLGTCKWLNETYEIIDVLPFIIFENAMKYSKKDEQINCEFQNTNDRLSKIIITNKAYLPDSIELPKLFIKKFRAKSASEIPGTGVGLYVAKLICEFNNIDLEITTKEDNVFDGKSYGDFIVTLKIESDNSN
jgi:signal transduction histidine kinase